MREIILLAGASLALAGCARDDNEANNMSAQNAAVENIIMNDPAAANAVANIEGNAAIDPATRNMMMNDLTTNDADTNLANGM